MFASSFRQHRFVTIAAFLLAGMSAVCGPSLGTRSRGIIAGVCEDSVIFNSTDALVGQTLVRATPAPDAGTFTGWTFGMRSPNSVRQIVLLMKAPASGTLANTACAKSNGTTRGGLGGPGFGGGAMASMPAARSRRADRYNPYVDSVARPWPVPCEVAGLGRVEHHLNPPKSMNQPALPA